MIKTLVSTKETQGQRDNDFCFTYDGELLYFGTVCDEDMDNPDGSCGCSRSMVGFDTLKSTTTMRVENVDMTEEEYLRKYLDTLKKGGWIRGEISEADMEDYTKEIERILDIARDFEVGSVLEFRADHFNKRR